MMKSNNIKSISRSGWIRTIQLAVMSLFLSAALSSCHDMPDYHDDPYGNFDALAEIVGNRYCYFREKNIDWKEVTARYRARVTPDMNQIELFDLMAGMLDELRDGHVNLSSNFNTSYYRKWWTDYPQDFNLRTLQQYYLDFDYGSTTGIMYKMMPDSIGYLYYPSFSSPISETNLDYILAILYKSKGLIIDIRNNGGGLHTNIKTLVSRFIDHKITGGYIRHKTGPEPDAFSEPYPIEYSPADPRRISYLKRPVMILTNRSCFSSANDFVAVMKSLPNVRIAGARTGGGGGMPFSSELPNGWSVRFSSSSLTDSQDRNTEFGIDPSPGCEVHCTDEELAAGIDRILDFALNALKPKE